MKIELPVLEMGELHLSMETLAGSHVFVKDHPALLSAERKLRGVMERFGATRKEGCWLILKRHAQRKVGVKLDREEAVTVYVFVKRAVDLVRIKPVSQSILSIFSQISLKLELDGIALRP